MWKQSLILLAFLSVACDDNATRQTSTGLDPADECLKVAQHFLGDISLVESKKSGYEPFYGVDLTVTSAKGTKTVTCKYLINEEREQLYFATIGFDGEFVDNFKAIKGFVQATLEGQDKGKEKQAIIFHATEIKNLLLTQATR
jgi:hypothetical protein